MLISNLFDLQRWINENEILFFNADEFKCKHCGKVLIDTELIKILDNLRLKFNKPIIITSGYRCPEYNKQVGGVPHSAHTKGKAVDIKITNSRDRFDFINLLLKETNISRIGISKDFIHIDIDKTKTNKVMWVY